MIIIKDMAIEWWESLRPIGWDLAKHLKSPTINCSTEKERNLARAIASHLK